MVPEVKLLRFKLPAMRQDELKIAADYVYHHCDVLKLKLWVSQCLLEWELVKMDCITEKTSQLAGGMVPRGTVTVPNKPWVGVSILTSRPRSATQQ